MNYLQVKNENLLLKLKAQSSDCNTNLVHHSLSSESMVSITHHLIEPLPSTPLTFQSAIEQLCPRKAKTLSLPPWSNETETSIYSTQHDKCVRQLSTLLRIASSDNKSTATDLLMNA